MKSKQISDLEATIKGTSRIYAAGQGMAIKELLANAQGEVIPDLTGGNKFFIEMIMDTQILMVENDRGQDLSILVFNISGSVLTFDPPYRLLGDVPSTVPEAMILINISCFGDGRPWVVINNEPLKK